MKALRPEERRRQSKEIVKRVFRHPKFLEARSLLTYLAAGSEVETAAILAEATREGKKVYVPCLDSKKKEMAMIEWSGGEKLKPNRYGILEPPFNAKRIGDPKHLDSLSQSVQGGRSGGVRQDYLF